MKHILLIGGAGYIGTVITKYFLDQNLKVRILDNLIYDNKNVADAFLNMDNFSFVKGDLCNQSYVLNYKLVSEKKPEKEKMFLINKFFLF